MREVNQTLREVAEHRRELMPLVPIHAGDKDFMEKHKPVWKGA